MGSRKSKQFSQDPMGQPWYGKLLWADPAEDLGSAACPMGHSVPKQSGEVTEEVCPVGPDARKVWLQNYDIEHSSDTLPEKVQYQTNVNLPIEREVSSIPRSNSLGNWVYPSQKQFFEAMHRKNWEPETRDMKTVVPIHNAVNERAWAQILMWEKNQGAEQCGGLSLTSFKGDSKKLTPRARWKMLLGYQKPFDRHDWTVDRCGKQIGYVIDFYSGKAEGNNPSFYLDVRPKLDTLEGWRLRLAKAVGL